MGEIVGLIITLVKLILKILLFLVYVFLGIAAFFIFVILLSLLLMPLAWGKDKLIELATNYIREKNPNSILIREFPKRNHGSSQER